MEMASKWLERCSLLAICLFLVTLASACGGVSDDGADEMTKAEAAQELLGNGNGNGSLPDYCALHDWYGDGVCDEFCPELDPDCESPGAPDDSYEPCAGKACGETCTLCAPDDPDCVETQDIKVCGADGTCGVAEPMCDAPEPPSYDPCAGKVCGETCTLCAPDDPDCVETMEIKVCGADGTCGVAEPMCDAPEPPSYDPCAGKVCGETCTLCAPDDPDCVETMEIKTCQPDGSCSSEASSCR